MVSEKLLSSFPTPGTFSLSFLVLGSGYQDLILLRGMGVADRGAGEVGTDNRPFSLAMRTFTNVISLAAWGQRSVWSWGRRTERQSVKTRTDSFQEL